MERATDRIIDGYVEKHHIIPKCMGGDDRPRNLVSLTPEEHYLAHQLLVKIYPNDNKLVYAANMMTVKDGNQKRTNKEYGWIKRKRSKILSRNMKGNIHSLGLKHSTETKKKRNSALTGKKRTATTKKLLSESQKGDSNSFYGRTHTQEFKESLRIKMLGNKLSLGKTLSDDHKNKISKSLTGKRHSTATKYLQSEKAKLRWEKKRIESEMAKN